MFNIKYDVSFLEDRNVDIAGDLQGSSFLQRVDTACCLHIYFHCALFVEWPSELRHIG